MDGSNKFDQSRSAARADLAGGLAAPGSSPAAQNGAVPRDADGGSILEGDDEEASRKERNRAAAKRSRELARQHVTQLEQSVALLAQDSETLMMRLAHV